MNRREHLSRVRLSRGERVAILGNQPLKDGELSRQVRVRLQESLWSYFGGLDPIERGAVVEAGLKALGVNHVKEG